MKQNYDIIIIGAGIAGICTAYELIEQRPDLNIIMFEQGNNIYQRICPIIAKKSEKCISCTNCSIMNGFGGAGSFSDGKYNITTEFGGWLNRYIADEEATNKFYSTDNEVARKIERRALQYDLHLLHAKVKHLGTENNLNILKKMYDYLEDKVHIRCNTKVENIVKEEDGTFSVTLEDGISVHSEFLVAAPGRAGAEWFSNICKELDIPLINNQVDIGVRVEVPAVLLQEITDHIYEAKIKYRTKCYGDIIRTFCMNPNGYVVTENVDGILTVNGHSYTDKELGSNNTNFALLVSKEFTKPFKDPYQYGKRIASFSNLLGNGILVQRFGDLKRGRRTTRERIEKSFVKPTLTSAEPGDLSLVIVTDDCGKTIFY